MGFPHSDTPRRHASARAYLPERRQLGANGGHPHHVAHGLEPPPPPLFFTAT